MQDDDLRGKVLEAFYHHRHERLVNVDNVLKGLDIPSDRKGSILRQLEEQGLIENLSKPINELGDGRITAKGRGVVEEKIRQARAVGPMRERIRERLTEYRAEALESIVTAEARTKSSHAGRGTLNSSMRYLAINEDNESGFAKCMDRSADFIRQLAGSSALDYADELRDAANKLKQDIIARMDRQNEGALPGRAGVEIGNRLEAALDKIIKRKVEDFEWNIGGKDMTGGTTQNTVNIINSNIPMPSCKSLNLGRTPSRRRRLKAWSE